MDDFIAPQTTSESPLPDLPSLKSIGKRRAQSPDNEADNYKRQRTSTSDARQAMAIAAAPSSASTGNSSRVIIPSLPQSPAVQEELSGDDDDDDDDGSDNDTQEQPVKTTHAPTLPESYTISPPAERIMPATSFEDLLGGENQAAQTSRSAIQEQDPEQIDELYDENDEEEEDDENSYRPGFNLNSALQAGPSNSNNNNASTSTASTSAIVDLTEAPSPISSSNKSSSPSSATPIPSSPSLPPAPFGYAAGSSTNSAILIQDSPTPPLRPLADPLARLEASVNGRCGVLAGSTELDEGETLLEKEEEEEVKVTLGELVCPICLGPPTPLVLTECGHAFCGPCLHSALTSQPITQQTVRDLPNIGGKELEGTCPVCRHPLAGGWGKALRGAVLRMQEVEVSC